MRRKSRRWAKLVLQPPILSFICASPACRFRATTITEYQTLTSLLQSVTMGREVYHDKVSQKFYTRMYSAICHRLRVSPLDCGVLRPGWWSASDGPAYTRSCTTRQILMLTSSLSMHSFGTSFERICTKQTESQRCDAKMASVSGT
jgi:hypothetical protein